MAVADEDPILKREQLLRSGRPSVVARASSESAEVNLGALYYAIGRTRARVKGGPGVRVETPDGVGKLWQVFSDRVGVDIRGRVHFFHPNCVRILPESNDMEMLR